MHLIASGRARQTLVGTLLALGITLPLLLLPHALYAACADSVLVRSAKTYSITSGSLVTFVEPCTLSAISGRRVLIEVLRPGTSNPLTSARVAYGGVEYFGTGDLAATNQLLSKVVTPQAGALLKVTLQGSTGGRVVVRATHVPEPMFVVYSAGNLTGNSNNALSKTYTKNFSPVNGVPPAPHVMRIVNGAADSTGALRTTDTQIDLNSGGVVGSGELTSGIASLARDVTVSDVNTLVITIPPGNAGKKLSLTIYATDNAGPSVAVGTPVDSLVTKAPTVAGSATVVDVETGTRLFLNGAEQTLTVNSWTGTINLPSADGKSSYTFMGQNGACLQDSIRRTVIKDTKAPTLSVSSPANGQVLSSGSTSVTISGQVVDSTRTTVMVEGDTVGVFPPNGTTLTPFSKSVPLDAGSNSLLVRAIDAAGNVTSVALRVLVPPSLGALLGSTVTPSGVAPVGSPTFRSQIGFLYNSTSPLQFGADTTKILSGSEGVVRGVVANRDFGPLPNVRVSVLNHPEYGASISRANGEFDLALTGGAPYVLRFYLAGYLEGQRSVYAPNLDFAVLDTVALVGRSSSGVATDTSQTRIVSGKLEADLNSDRRLFALVPHGAVATITPDSGGVLTLTNYRVRTKEFTVGGDGQNTMPGALPSTTAYTYCADLSLVEADSLADLMGPRHPAPQIVFSKPIVTYVREFLGVPVGTAIPSGYYDQSTGRWVADENGRVIKVLSVVGGIANLDTDGNSSADSDSLYSVAGVDTLERTMIATQFRSGDVLWRSRVTHFSSHDFNLNMGQILGLGNPTGGDAGPASLSIGDPSKTCGCIIENENRVLGESIPLKGSSFAINYRSSRQPGDNASRWIRIPLTGATVPSGLTAVRLVVTVAGRQYKQTYAGVGSNDVRMFTDWDGTDAYGRKVPGSVTATVKLGFVFPQSYSLSSTSSRDFGSRASIKTAPSMATWGNRSNGYTEWHTYRVAVGAPSMASAGLGGWTIAPHHFLDVNGDGALYMGNGGVRYGKVQYPTIKKYVGDGQYCDNLTSATKPRLTARVTPSAMAFGPDGSLYYVNHIGIGNGAHPMVLRLKPDGATVPWLGCPSCDNGIVTNFPVDGGYGADPTKRLASPSSLAMGPDGSLYVLDDVWRQVYRITPDDTVHVVMGSYALGLGIFQDGAVAKTRALRGPAALAVGPEGDVYIGDSGWKRVIRIGADGLMHAFAGDSCCVVGTQGKADSLMLQSGIGGLAADANGNVFISESPRLWQVTPDGRMRTITAPDHGVAKISAGADGALYICTDDGFSGVVRRTGDGTLSAIAGLYPDVISGASVPANFASEEGGFAAAARMQGLTEALLGPDGGIYVSQAGPSGTDGDRFGTGIRRIGSEQPLVKSNELYYPSEDGREVFVFTPEGRHVRTVDVTTGVSRFVFAYDAGGRLTKITEPDSSRTIIQRTTGGVPIAVVAPFGQRMTITLDGNGFLNAVTDSVADESYSMTSSTGGLLQGFTDPRGNQDVFTYRSDDGRLETNRDPALVTQTFAQTTTGPTQTVTRTTQSNRVTTYQITRMLDGLRRRLASHPGGAWSYRADSMNTATAPFGGVVRERGVAGEVTLVYPQGDKRYRTLAEVPSTTYTILPSSVRRTTTSTRDTLLGGVVTETYGVNGNTFTNTYTSTTRTSLTSTPSGRSSTVVLDASGRPTSVAVGSSLPALTIHYDGSGHVDLISQGGEGWRYGYDGFGRLVTCRDTLQRTVSYGYNNADRVKTMTLPGNLTVSLGMNANGVVDTLVTPAGRVHRFGYTALDQNSSYTPPALSGAAGNPTTYEYNTDRQLTKVTRPDGQLLVARYSSSSGRLDSLMQSRGKTAFSYFTSGQVQSVTSPDGITLNYGYDGPIPRMESWTGLRGAGAVDSLSCRVNIAFQDSVETLDGAQPVTYLYDADGLLSSVGVNGSTEAISRRSGDGLLSGTNVGGVTSALSYDSHGQLWTLRYDWPGAGSFQQVLGRDSLGRVVKVTESGMAAHTYDYHYDAAGRLDSVAVDGAKWAGYTYDLDGNLVARRGAAPTDTLTATLDAQERLMRYGTRAYSYTAAGELASRVGGATDTLRTTYDALGNLLGAHLANGDSISYVIDGANRRVVRRVNGFGRTSWMYTGGIFVAAELDSTGAVRNRYVYATSGHAPDLLVQGGTTYRLVTDLLGSVRAVVNVTSGAVAQQLDYDAWGVLTTDTAPMFQSLGYAGGLTDRATGLVRFGVRDYEPGVGRWTGKDPIGIGTRRTNPYLYANNAPPSFFDDNGLTAKSNGEFFNDWMGGHGARSRSYGPGTVESDEMRDSPGATKLRERFVKNGCKSFSDGSFGTFEAYASTIGDPTSTAFQVGGFAGASVTDNGDGTITVIIPNVAGTHSFWLHAVPNRKSPTGSMSNIYQVFYWVEPNPCPACYK